MADIGCDHGYVCIELILRGISPFCIACDLREGPAERARRHFELYGISSKAEVRVGDGLTVLRPGETDSIVIAGMGGKTILSILEEGMDQARQAKELILGPQSEERTVREFLYDHGLPIRNETLVLEDGKYYPLIRSVPLPDGEKEERPGEAGLMYGPCLLRKRDGTLLRRLNEREQWLEKLIRELSGSDKEPARNRSEELKMELLVTRQAKQYYE